LLNDSVGATALWRLDIRHRQGLWVIRYGAMMIGKGGIIFGDVVTLSAGASIVGKFYTPQFCIKSYRYN